MTGMMTQSQFAAYKGVGRSAVSNWKKQGHLILVEGVDGRPMVDVARTDMRLNARIDPMRGRPTTAAPAAEAAPIAAVQGDQGGGSTVATERLELMREQRISQSIKNRQAAGDLVPLVEGLRRWGEAARLLRERMQAELRGQAERLTALGETRSVMLLLEETIDRVFTDVAAEIERFDDDEDEIDQADSAEAA